MIPRPEQPTRPDDARPDVSEFDGGAPDPTDLDAGPGAVRPDEYAPTGGDASVRAGSADEADVLEQGLEVGFDEDDATVTPEEDRA